jgi:hypothetical protein
MQETYGIHPFGPGKQFQHFIPQLLLDNWCDQGGHLYRFSKPTEGKLVCKKTAKKSTGGEYNLYTLNSLSRWSTDFDDMYDDKREKPQQVQFVENYLARQIDTQFVKDAINKMRAGIFPDDREKFDIVRLILSLIVRNPPHIVKLLTHERSNIQRKIDDIDEFLVSSDGSALDKEEFLLRFSWIQKQGVILKDLNPHLFQMIHLINNRTLISALCECHWVVAKLYDSVPDLIISDCPVINGVKSEEEFPFVVGMPISPREYLVLVDSGKPEEFRIKFKTSNIFELASKRQIMQAYKSVYATSKGAEDFVRANWL